MKKNLIICGVILIILIIFCVIPAFSNENTIINSLKSYGFNDAGDEITFNKLISDFDYNDYINDGSLFDTLSYNTESFELKRNIMQVKSDVDITYNGTLSYVDNQITYNYRVVYDESNIILNGIYIFENQNFTCDSEYIYGVELDDLTNDLCLDARNYTIELYDMSNDIFTEDDLEYINKNTGN